VTTQRVLRYDGCRDALTLLADDAPIVALIDAVGESRGWWIGGRSWRREYGRLDLGGDSFVTLLFESGSTRALQQELCTVDVWSVRPSAEALQLDGVGWVTMRRFPDDDRLPTLPAVLSEPGDVEVLRYRPGKRCTLRVVSPAHGSRFVKVFAHGAEGVAMHADACAIWAAASAGELGFAVAPPIRWDAATSSFWQGAVAGESATTVLFGADGASLAVAMGEAASTLTTSALRPSRQAGRTRQMKRSAKYADRIAAAFAELRNPLDELLARLADLHAGDTDDRLRPIHGAPHPHQWLLDGDRLGLVDFDGFALGPPELDVATFVAEMEYENPDRMPVAAIIDGFRTGYEHGAGPLDDRILRAYLAHKRLAKAQRNARAIRPDNDLRAAAAIEDALDLVRA
jgi:Phosphotransferase enzyme family